jgi:hypothetical protein
LRDHRLAKVPAVFLAFSPVFVAGWRQVGILRGRVNRCATQSVDRTQGSGNSLWDNARPLKTRPTPATAPNGLIHGEIAT